ncbi:mammalian cell entry protein [Robbsia andropogonis]|uniref:Mammalian cell entry protein n=1 Tax=Robbsia andropogonis TaxID=28092 RepID=A0A0F5K2Z4_9BURK|nr:MlaD family protein [Robbsia andropogonis]KKB64234.1 mammalian cell entry protein [Robbsia andropogonis]
MNDPLNGTPEPPLPASRHRIPVSVVWLVPAIAVLIGISMLVHGLMTKGPVITISFRTAAGLTEGKTAVKYKDVTVGTVSSVDLSDGGTHVIAKVALTNSARSLANAETRFWVVRPRIGAGGASGIDTLLSGSYIGVDKGTSSEHQTDFVGLETPPSVINGTPGRSFSLRTDELGSIDVNSPVYYRHIQVGRVASYQLDDDGKHVSLQLFIDAPYDRFVTENTRFWNASGVDISLNATGLKVNTQSLATVVTGGIAFATPDDGGGSPKPMYFLAKDQQAAMEPPHGPPVHFDLLFAQSLRGLVVGAPVVFSGRELGVVTSVDLDYDASKKRFPTLVGIDVYPKKLGRVLAKLPKFDGAADQQALHFLSIWVQHGLRAQAKAGNLLTGQLYISLDFVQNAAPVSFNPQMQPLYLPTISTAGVDQLEEKLNHVVDKIDKIPFDTIGLQLSANLSSLDATLKQVNGQLLPETTRTMQQAQGALGNAQQFLSPDSRLQQNINQALEEVQRSAQSVRSLVDYLNRHPESLLRGRRGDTDDASASDRISAAAKGADK